MAQDKTSLSQLRQALDDLRLALEGVESALIEFEEDLEGEEVPSVFRAQQPFNCSQ